jgi:predicted transcriptional regulator
MQQFLLTAIENQLALEEPENVEAFERQSSQTKPSYLSEASSVSAESSIVRSVRIVNEPNVDQVNGSKLWALHNRIFPVKLTVRLLAKLLEQESPEDGYIDAEKLEETVIGEATRLGRLLRNEEVRKKLENKLSTGLILKPAAKSSERFKDSFIGSIVHSKNDRRNLIDGAPGRLRLINIRSNSTNKSLQFGLTQAGYNFATLSNPILDDHTYVTSLSADEIDFYLQHVSEKLPEEYSACMSLLAAIAAGKNTPTSLVSVSTDDDATRASQVSRLVELELVHRERIGIRVEYALTERGKKYLGGFRKPKTMLTKTSSDLK